MNALKSFNKEQWVALVAVVFSVLAVATGLAGGLGAGESSRASATERAYEPFVPRFAEFPDERPERYSVGDLFKPQQASKLAVPPLRAPEPREEDPAAPPLRPAPVTEAYNKLQAKAPKYPAVSAVQPGVADADLPLQAVLDELKKLEEPQAQKPVDRRNDREVEFFTVILKSGGKPKQGSLLHEDAGVVIMINKDTRQRETFPRSMIANVIYNRTYEEQHRHESQKIQAGPKEAEDRVKLARKLIALGMVKEAKDELLLAVKAKRDHVEAIVLLAQLHYDGADFEGAVSACEGGLQAGAPAAELYYEIGRCLRALAFHEGAIAAFERAVENSPRHQNAKLALARAQLEAGNQAAALAAANDFFAKQASAPDTTAAHKSEAFLVRGLAALRGGDVGGARGDFEKVEAGNAEALNGLGAALALEGSWKEAGARFVEAIKANQYQIEAWTNLGTVLLLGGKAAEADAMFKKAAERDPVSVEPVLGQGLAALLLGKKEAAGLVDRAVQMDPGHVAARLALGHLKLREGADDEALAHFTAALRADTAYLPAYSGAAAAYLRTARKGAGEAAAQADESRATALLRLAQERRVNAETLLKQVRDFDAARASSWVALGCAYAAMGRADEARSALRAAALAMQPSGKADPLISYALGYVDYYDGSIPTVDGRLESAEREFAQGATLKGKATDAFSVRVIADCEQAVAEIEMWRKTSLRFDERFERESAKQLGSGWLESEDKYGIAISLENVKERGGRAKFSGKQAIADYGVTTMGREIPGEDFYAMEATLYADRTAKTEFGISIYYAKQGDAWVGFHAGLDVQGKVRFNVAAADPRDLDRREMQTGGWMEVRTPLPNPKEITIRISRGEKNRLPAFTISYWDPAKIEWIAAQKDVTVNLANTKGNWKVGVFCRAPVGTDVSFTVDNIRVYERSRR